MKKIHYDDDFKESISRLVVEAGKSATKVAEEYNVNKNTVCNWVNEFKKKNGMKLPARTAMAEERSKIKELDKQLKKKDQELKDKDMEIEILKKAMHIFMKDQNAK